MVPASLDDMAIKRNVIRFSLLKFIYFIALFAMPLHSQASSKWIEKKLNSAGCAEIIDQINSHQLEYSIHPEILTLVDIVRSECQNAPEPVAVVQDVFPIIIQNTNIYFEWTNNKKVIVKIIPETADTSGFVVLSSKTVIELHANNENQIENKKSTYVQWWSSTKENANHILNQGKTLIYISLVAWHDRNTYSPESIDQINEKAYGLGVGRSIINKNGNKEALYLNAHLDSHGMVEVESGYSWQKIFRPSNNIKIGVGYSAGLTSRTDIADRIPIPYILPLASIEYADSISLEAILIPKLDNGINHGNVVFIYLSKKME